MKNKKSRRNFIFVTTVFRFKSQNPTRRVWGWHSSFDEANKSILQNFGDVFECGYYQMGLIEKMSDGSMAMSKQEWWYRATTHPNGKIKISRAEKPKKLKNVVHFSMG